MIVVIGSPTALLRDGRIVAGGMPSRVATAAAGGGRDVQLIGRLGADPAADAVLLDLARSGVGHVAVLRDPARATPLEELPRPDDDTEEDADEPDGTRNGVATIAPETSTTPAPSLDAADVELGLRYLTDYRVVVVAEPSSPEVVAVAVDAARWGSARLVLVTASGTTVIDAIPPDATVMEAPPADPDGAFAAVVGRFAAALDDGAAPDEAFRGSLAADGWTEVPAD